MSQKVLVKFTYNLTPVVFTVPESYIYDLSYMRNVEWVSSVDGLNYFTGNIPDSATVTVNKPVFISEAVIAEIAELLRIGDPKVDYSSRYPSKIKAIKVVMNAANCSLKDAKDYIDTLCAEVNPHYPRVFDFYLDSDYDDLPF